MCIAAAAAVIGTGASIAGQIIGFNAQNKAAWEQRAYNVKVEAQDEKYRPNSYQNVVYQQEVDHGHTVQEWKEGEFARQAVARQNASASIQENLFAQYATILQRMVEEGMAASLNGTGVQRDAQALRAKAQAAAESRGIEGSSVEQMINDVSRQEGENLTVMELNRSAAQRQLNLEAMGLKASADQQLYNLPLQTYGPDAPVTPPPRPSRPCSPPPPFKAPTGAR